MDEEAPGSSAVYCTDTENLLRGDGSLGLSNAATGGDPCCFSLLPVVVTFAGIWR